MLLVLLPILSLACSLHAAKNQPHLHIAGFERFENSKIMDSTGAGRFLAGELNCLSCHHAGTETVSSIWTKQAPVLDNVASRVNLDYIRNFIANPQQVKPGTTMPALFQSDSPSERMAKVEALTQFLSRTGRIVHTLPPNAAILRGEKLFHSVGCIACHGAQDGKSPKPVDAIPLDSIDKKYSVFSLSKFLGNPHAVRPSGRMPSLNLNPKEARDISCYLLRNIQVPPNLNYTYYEGSWHRLPDFAKLKPVDHGQATGFQLDQARRNSQFGLRFTGFVHISKAGRYTFHIGCDDGGRIKIDGKAVVDNDGEHAVTFKSGNVELKTGPHEIVVEYFQQGGGVELVVQIEGQGIPKQDASGLITASREPPQKKKFRFDPSLAKKGKQLFASMGCASCHQLKILGKRIDSTLQAPAWNKLNSTQGCVSGKTSAKIPTFALSSEQRSVLQAFLVRKSSVDHRDLAEQKIERTMLTYNCYACHRRNKIGGVQQMQNARFLTTINEMGDEGRVPPPLDGVGDKLQDDWIKHVLENGVKDRPYMLTRMPKFGKGVAKLIVPAFVELDRKHAEHIPTIRGTKVSRLKSAGRKLTGANAFACIKCHTFGKYKATGIQSIDLVKMTSRVREDWFYRYMMNPNRYRPGTRMPTSFPGGISTLPNVLDGKPESQLVALWTYLKDGPKARVPMGLVQGAIQLTPKDEPIVYRNFIQGLSARGIAVGYPEHLNLAFDVERFSLSLIWHGAFIDASRHWVGRGQGFQEPLGDHLVNMAWGVPFAVLKHSSTVWPSTSAKKYGYDFSGYSLDQKRRPHFRYRFRDIQIDDFPLPVPGEEDPSLLRTLIVTGEKSTENIWYRAAVGKTIQKGKDGWYTLDENIQVRVNSSVHGEGIVRKSGSRQELVFPVKFRNGKAVIKQEYVW